MVNHKIYEPNDRMISLISDNREVLQSLGSFGINLGFGDKTVKEVCEEQHVDTFTFLTIVNFTINGYKSTPSIDKLHIPTLLKHLRACHEYYLGFQLPTIREQLVESVTPDDKIGQLILSLFDDFSRLMHRHMKYEERNVFPYIEKLIANQMPTDYDIETYSTHHEPTDDKLHELKDIIIKYLPSNGLLNNKLMATLYKLYSNEEWLKQHTRVEDEIMVPAIRLYEEKIGKNAISSNIEAMLTKAPHAKDALSEREKDIVICIVQGMTNQEIAGHLFISFNTVITHRRNIARKLQIHSSAGLTIYAIVNNLVDISNVKL